MEGIVCKVVLRFTVRFLKYYLKNRRALDLTALVPSEIARRQLIRVRPSISPEEIVAMTPYPDPSCNM